MRMRNSYCPMGHMGNALHAAHAALFLASDEARYITGALLVVDRGLTLRAAEAHAPRPICRARDMSARP